MNQTLSSRIKFIFKKDENAIEDIVYIKGVEGALNPENKIAKDHVLKGFSWKPTERPKSKKDAIGSAGKPKPKAKPKAKTPVVNGKATASQKPGTQAPTTAPDNVKNTARQDSLSKKNVLPKTTTIKDTSNFGIKPILPKKDSTTVKEIKKQ
jgi:hypothetical protein